MNPAATHLRERIAADGPVTVAEFMAIALGHPEGGYYMSGDPFGMAGDFITAPEVSQMFGEIIGLWLIVSWEQAGQPEKAKLVEIGPGRGTLMADIWRVIGDVPDFRAALTVHLVETSGELREAQSRALEGVPATWHEAFGEVPDGPVMLVANELFDALPIHQFVRMVGGWRERLVDLEPVSGEFRFVLATGPGEAETFIPDDVADLPPGTVVEVSPAARALADEIARRIARFGGRALIIDYATDRGADGDTLQAVRRHDRHQVLDAPGSADVSARVDFKALARSARDAGAQTFGPVDQGAFLRTLGIEARAEGLAKNATPEQRADIEAALGRLIDPGKMGTLFKVIAMAPRGAPTPAGFERTAPRC